MFWGRLRQSAPVLCKKSLVSSQTAKIIASEMNKDGQSKKKINKCEIREYLIVTLNEVRSER